MVPLGDCYVAMHIDLPGPSIAPRSGTPEAGRLSHDEMKALLAALAGRRAVGISGFDLFEVNPLYDLRTESQPSWSARSSWG